MQALALAKGQGCRVGEYPEGSGANAANQRMETPLFASLKAPGGRPQQLAARPRSRCFRSQPIHQKRLARIRWP